MPARRRRPLRRRDRDGGGGERASLCAPARALQRCAEGAGGAKAWSRWRPRALLDCDRRREGAAGQEGAGEPPAAVLPSLLPLQALSPSPGSRPPRGAPHTAASSRAAARDPTIGSSGSWPAASRSKRAPLEHTGGRRRRRRRRRRRSSPLPSQAPRAPQAEPDLDGCVAGDQPCSGGRLELRLTSGGRGAAAGRRPAITAQPRR